jgi:hypothetical protein
MASRTLQQQGVPVPSRLRGPSPAYQGRHRRTSEAARPAPRAQTAARKTGTGSQGSISPGDLSPVRQGSNTASGVGLLEAEFLVAIVLLVMLMFADTSSDYASKVMSVMKRGTLVCVVFFVLAIVASTGSNAAKIAKAFGALMIFAIVITSPMTTVLKDFDNIIKNDWVSTGETADQTAPSSADTGTNNATSTSTANLGTDIVNAVKQELGTEGQSGGKGISSAVKNALNATLNGINPAVGEIFSKIGL